MDGPGHHVERLDPIDGFLNVRRQVLDAQAGPVQPVEGGGLHPTLRQDGGVQLGRDLDARREGKHVPHRAEQANQIVAAQHVRRAAAQMHRACLDPPGQPLFDQDQLIDQVVDIVADQRRLVHHPGVAAAVPAQPIAERDMGVERDRLGGIQRAQPIAIDVGVDRVRELQGGRIAGVARRAAIVACQQIVA